MRFVLTIGRMTLFHISLFEIQEPFTDPDADVVVVHHHYEDDEDKDDGPSDMFGGK